MTINSEIMVRAFIIICGTVAFVIAFLGFVDVWFYGGSLVFGDWASGSQMSAPTSVCIMIVSTIDIVLGWNNRLWRYR